MTLEVCEVDHEIVVLKVASDAVVLDPFVIDHGDVYGAFGIHDVHGGYLLVAAFLDGLPVALGVGTAAAIGRVAFHEGPVHGMYEILDERRAEVVALGGFAG